MLLGVSRATLWRMLKEGSLEKVEIYHNSFRLRRADIMELARTSTAPRWRSRNREQAE
jgi:excisionase family DNA binding protein